MLHGLQGLSLLQSLIIEAMVSSRLHLGKEPFHLGFFWRRCFPWLHFQRCFPWALSFICIAALAFGCAAFVFILQGVYDELSRVFVVTAVVTAHGFLACFSLRHIHGRAFDYYTYIAGCCILYFNLASLPASVLVSLCSSITTFLLAEISLSFTSNVLWVSLMLYNFEYRDRPELELHDEAETSVAHPSITSKGGADKSNVLNDFSLGSINSVDNYTLMRADLELQGQC